MSVRTINPVNPLPSGAFSRETEYVNPATEKGWSLREEEIIAHIVSVEKCPRVSAIQIMRRRKLDDLRGKIRNWTTTSGDTPMPNSPIGLTVQKISELYPDLSPEECCDHAGVLHEQAAGRKNYRVTVLSLEQAKKRDDLLANMNFADTRITGIASVALMPNKAKNEGSELVDNVDVLKRRNSAVNATETVGLPVSSQQALEVVAETNLISSPDKHQELQQVIDIPEKRGRKRVFGSDEERKAAHRAIRKENSTIVLPPLPEGVRNAPPLSRNGRKRVDSAARTVLLIRQGKRCFFCDREFGRYVKKGANGIPQMLRAELEHFIPKGVQGSRKQDNLHASCQICNLIKRRKVGFISAEECREWLKQAWEMNGYIDLGNPTLWKFTAGEHQFASTYDPPSCPFNG